jgi:hypothetical protein
MRACIVPLVDGADATLQLSVPQCADLLSHAVTTGARLSQVEV